QLRQHANRQCIGPSSLLHATPPTQTYTLSLHDALPIYYGKVITTVPLPGPGATGNEPHHVGLSRDGKVLACGGLLSVLRAQKEIDRKSTRLNSSHLVISYAVFCLKKKKQADEQCLGL